jgi:hypothetical protein
MSQLFKGIRDLRIQRVRARSEKLVTNNRHREAIDLLQSANKRIHSPEIEKYLVDLRHEAFFHESFSSQFPNWPPTISDRFKTTDHIPEITTDQMSSDIVRDGVFSKGSIIIRGLLGNDDVVKIREGIELTYQNHDLSRTGYSKEQTAPWFVPFEPTQRHPDQVLNRDWYRDGGAELAADSPRGLFNLLECLERNGIIDLVTGYLGERPALSVRKTSLRRIPHDLNADNGWHQDGAFLGKGIRTMNLWIALTDCGVDAPSMDMVPHRLQNIVPTGTEGAAFEWSVSSKIIEEVCDGEAPTHLHFKAGDAIIFDEMNLHRTSTRPGMTKSRFAVEAWFFAPSCYPIEQLPILI